MQPRPWHRSYDAGASPAIAFDPLTLPQFLALAAAEHGDAQTAVLKILRPELPGQQLRKRLRGDQA